MSGHSDEAAGSPLPRDIEQPDRRPGPDGPAPAEETVLVEDFLQGRPAAVNTVSAWARSVTGHRIWGFESSEDVVQATLLALVQNLRAGRFQGGNLRAYVRRIAKNMCISHYRRLRARGDHVSLDDEARSLTGGVSGEDLQRRAMVRRILERLNESCRQIVVLAYEQGYSRREIGERLRMSEEAVRVRLFRCIRTARDLLSGLGEASVGRT